MLAHARQAMHETSSQRLATILDRFEAETVDPPTSPRRLAL
ncbi:hypothetical protein [Alloactinosynnema sp. L-07]|nr:hypothetical protein [Alloactinosynnema sp. L-07]